MAALPDDHPMMIAWEAHRKTPDFANSRYWSANDKHVDGSLWAVFCAGWEAGIESASDRIHELEVFIEAEGRCLITPANDTDEDKQ